MFFGSCPKDLSNPDSNEDKFAYSSNCERIALCDGASESYDSQTWAQILSAKYVSDPAVASDWVDAAILEYEAKNDHSSLSWSKQAAYERGSFSTLLGIEHDPIHKTIEVLAIGDSVAILVNKRAEIINSYPFEDPERFKEHPTLLSTLPTHNSFIRDSYFWTRCGKTFHLGSESSSILLCMTDALAEWALKDFLSHGVGLSTLISISSEEELNVLVVEERAAKRMRVDDSTLLSFTFESGVLENGIPQS